MQITVRILLAQCLLGVVIAAGWLLDGPRAALAASGGAASAILPALYLRWRMLQAVRLRDQPRELLGLVYRGQFGKFAMTLVLFGLVFARFPDEFLPVMSGFAGCLTAYFFGMMGADQLDLDETFNGQRKR